MISNPIIVPVRLRREVVTKFIQISTIVLYIINYHNINIYIYKMIVMFMESSWDSNCNCIVYPETWVSSSFIPPPWFRQRGWCEWPGTHQSIGAMLLSSCLQPPARFMATNLEEPTRKHEKPRAFSLKFKELPCQCVHPVRRAVQKDSKGGIFCQTHEIQLI